MTKVIPEELKAKMSSHFLKGEDFADGLMLKVVSFEVINAKDPKYGATEVDYLFKSEKLAKGETFKYTFETVVSNEDLEMPEEKVFESKSAPFFIAFSQVDPDAGDVVMIKRNGEGTKTTYKVEKK
jgi:hypothetical protein